LHKISQPFNLTGITINSPSERKDERQHRAKGKGIHINRAFGSDCHNCVIDGDIDAGSAACQGTLFFRTRNHLVAIAEQKQQE
jgi:hypothetical protein